MEESGTPKNIIVRMPNWIGDFVMATPVLTDLRAAFPSAEITAMCKSPLGELLREDPEVDALFGFGRASRFARRVECRNVIEKLRKGRYDLGVLLTHSFSSAWWFWRGRVKRRLGYEGKGRRFFLTDPLPFPESLDKQHLVTTYKMLLGPLGIPPSSSAPRLRLNQQEIQEARDLLGQQGIAEGARIVGINPGAAYGSAKCWPPERFRQITERLLADPALHILYLGDQASVPLVKQICQGLPGRVVSLAGQTSLRELASLIHLSALLLTNDSGPMHIADALDKPVVALFGSTDPAVTGPYRKGSVIYKQVSCSPCYRRTCPIDFRCMRQIEVEEVYQEICRLLRAPPC